MLRLAARRHPDDDDLARAGEELAHALQELRELARGIHPAVLTERGLEPALRALADRAPVPVELSYAPTDRLPGPVEAAAYYVVSEALTNVAKYAHASVVRVRVDRSDGAALIEVADDGAGGADPSGGSGLRGLADRVEALGGRLTVESPVGEGTTLRAALPISGKPPT
jgi:signal transduction histidine kinase